MKVEIELSEIESLRQQLNFAKERVKTLEEENYSFKQSELIDKANKLSWKLFNAYINTVFKQIGFDQDTNHPITVDYQVSTDVGTKWWERNDLKFTIDARFYAGVKNAFLNIGVMPKEKEKSDLLFKL